jgi:hypothetical protein
MPLDTWKRQPFHLGLTSVAELETFSIFLDFLDLTKRHCKAAPLSNNDLRMW